MLRIEKLFIQGFKSFCDPTEVAFDQEGITAVVGPNGCGKCVVGATPVTLADGREVTIRDLVEEALRAAEHVEQLGDGTLTRENPRQIEILSLHPTTLRLEPRPVAAFIKRTATPHLLRIHTRSGREVTATPYHPLFTLEHGRLRALRADELQVGVRIAVPRQLPVAAQSDVYGDEIVAVEQVEPTDDWVYDLSIAETHNFVAGNIIVHNSNIADAISWVIGEQRAKALRGGKMEDVIFQGSRNRTPSGMAEVMLTMLVRETFELRGEPEHVAEAADALVIQSTAALAHSAAPAAVAAPPEAAAPAASTEAAAAAEAAKKKRKAVKSTAIVFQAGERITVGRRLYRTGESEYEMNGRACRLRDIQDLFAGTGLGGAHYAIIEQGRIGQVLSAKPLDRRALIEEAAGVSKFKLRQHVAELKLDAARQNLARLSDIMLEVERQQNSLKRQAARARRYQRLRREMRDLLRAVYVVDYRATAAAVAELEARLADVATREAQCHARLVGRETEQTVAAQAALGAEAELNEARTVAANLELESERARQQHAYSTEQLQTLGARAADFAREQAAINERREIIAQETARLRAELHRLEAEINAESKALTAEEDEQRAQLQRNAEAERRLDEARRQGYESATHLERWRQLQRQFTEAIERSAARLNGLAAERERAHAQAAAADEQFAALTEKFTATTERQAEVGEEMARVTAQLNEQRRNQTAQQAALTALHREQSAVEHRLQSLVELDERHAYFSEAVQLLMNRPVHANGFRALGTLADFVRVAPEHEVMIETGLRDELQYVVVPTFNDALRAIEFLKAENGGRATFLVVEPEAPADHRPAASATNGHRPLSSLLGLHPEFAVAFRLALPGLAGAKVVENAAQAVEVSRHVNGSGPTISLSRTGERVVAGRLVTGGSGAATGAGVLALKREIAELHERQTTLAAAAERAEDELHALNERIALLETERAELDDELRRLERQLAVEREQQQQCRRETERIAALLGVVQREMQQAHAEQAEFEGKLRHAAQQTTEAERAHAEGEQRSAAAQAELAELRRASEQRAQELSARRAEFAARTERRRGQQNDLRRLEHEAGELHQRLDRSRLEEAAAAQQAGEMQFSLTEFTRQIERLATQRALAAAELAQCTAALNAVRERLGALEAELRAARETAHQVREERAQGEIEHARLTGNLAHIAQACYTELNERIVEVLARLDAAPPVTAGEAADAVLALVRPGAADAADAAVMEGGEDEESEPVFEPAFWQVPTDFELETAKARLDELRVKIDGLGPVNMLALAELAEIEARFLFLVGQKADIDQAVADTQAAIAEIKRRSRERFQAAFTAINRHFSQMFQELFGGGHGEMRLIDETDMLESGIEIIAQPPGKRLQNVLLLSGGEKAMTAIALVMAIFKYRPSPFCLLDEVDAPLDEMNIGRFSDKVLEMSAHTQFVLITHSKRTMEVARTLYGVTMEDPGVSKLISVRLT